MARRIVHQGMSCSSSSLTLLLSQVVTLLMEALKHEHNIIVLTTFQTDSAGKLLVDSDTAPPDTHKVWLEVSLIGFL